MNITMRNLLIAALVTIPLVPAIAADEPDFILSVELDVQELGASVRAIEVVCDVYIRNRHSGARGSAYIPLQGAKAPKSYQGVVTVPVTMRDNERASDVDRYICRLEIYKDDTRAPPIKAPAPANVAWRTARPDKPFIPRVKGQIPGR